jgi:hypothetical protein
MPFLPLAACGEALQARRIGVDGICCPGQQLSRRLPRAQWKGVAVHLTASRDEGSIASWCEEYEK